MTEQQKRELEELRKRLGMKVDPTLAERQWNRAIGAALPTTLIDAMAANAARIADPCGICHVGRGRQCVGERHERTTYHPAP